MYFVPLNFLNELFVSLASSKKKSAFKKFKGTKYNKTRIDAYKKERKKIFGSKSNVLRSDDFYEKMSEKVIQTKKKKGAISGCNRFSI